MLDIQMISPGELMRTTTVDRFTQKNTGHGFY